MSEKDVKRNFITPALEKSGWFNSHIRMEYPFTDGQILVEGKRPRRGKQKRADYLLLKSGRFPLAVVEAKNLNHSAESGLQQAMNYAQILQIPFAFSSNGKYFVEHDFLTGQERNIPIDKFPTENELWQRYLSAKNLNDAQKKIILTPDHFDFFKKTKPRYYQRIAIDKTVQAVAEGQKRILLVMATGTGKTFTAFQIIWKLLNSKKVQRVLYLADRNILIDQTIINDFKPFEKVLCKVEHKKLDSSYKVFMSLYHQLAGDEGDEPFRQFKPEFFDLVIVDECHRGSAKADSEWRRILNYFNGAIHIGMTATPKETKEVSNSTYFGEPIYTYSLKQGILDGFLAPFKVIRVNIDRDFEGWRPYNGQRDIYGNLITDKIFQQQDFDDTLFIEERTKLVAKRITRWLKENGRFSKTIVFCMNTKHADLMRLALINENSDIVKKIPKYVMKITGDDDEGKRNLTNFTLPDDTPPIIATTAELLTTGVDCKTVKLIVIDKTVDSMITFKQIIGRGTRLRPDCGKEFFTIMDFRGATSKFADPEFDGAPIVILDDSDGGDDNGGTNTDDNDDLPPEHVKQKFYVNGVEVQILNERVQFIDATGKLITENLIDYTRKNILGQFSTLENFLKNWSDAKIKHSLIDELFKNGIWLGLLRDTYNFSDDVDDFDLILHVAYDRKLVTRKSRADFAKSKVFIKSFPEKCRAVLNALLDKYADNGITELETLQVLKNEPFASIGSRKDIFQLFGGKEGYRRVVAELKNLLYQVA